MISTRFAFRTMPSWGLLERRIEDLQLFAFVLYIGVHELIHIVRFGYFLQGFVATAAEMMAEETRVHRLTREIVRPTAGAWNRCSAQLSSPTGTRPSTG